MGVHDIYIYIRYMSLCVRQVGGAKNAEVIARGSTMPDGLPRYLTQVVWRGVYPCPKSAFLRQFEQFPVMVITLW